jgi:hypothetical protein
VRGKRWQELKKREVCGKMDESEELSSVDSF